MSCLSERKWGCFANKTRLYLAVSQIASPDAACSLQHLQDSMLLACKPPAPGVIYSFQNRIWNASTRYPSASLWR